MNDDRIIARSVQPGSDHRGNLVLTVLTASDPENPTSGQMETTEYVLPWNLATMLYSNLHGQMAVMNEERMRNAAAGDCATCGNWRMIQTEKYGRPWTKACPDCRPVYDGAKPAYPEDARTAPESGL